MANSHCALLFSVFVTVMFHILGSKNGIVGRASALGQPTRPAQHSIPSGSENWMYMDYVSEGGHHWTADQGCVWLFGCKIVKVPCVRA